MIKLRYFYCLIGFVLSATSLANSVPEKEAVKIHKAYTQEVMQPQADCLSKKTEKACFEWGLIEYKYAKNTDYLILAAQDILRDSCKNGYLDSCSVLSERSLAEYVGHKDNGPVFQHLPSCSKVKTLTLCGGMGKTVNMVNRTLSRATENNQLACDQGYELACRVLPWLKKKPENTEVKK